MPRLLYALAAAWALSGTCAADAPHPPWPDTFTARLEALAILQTLNAELLSHDSATLTLERWCGAHHLALPARVTALRIAGADRPPSPEQRRELQVAESEDVRYRRVRLMCGTVALSEADNWYVPGRLSAEMNQQLGSSDTPFGKVVAPLKFQRRTLAAALLWQPLPEGWEMGLAVPRVHGPLCIPAQVLQHRALLTLPDGTPFSEVIETYTDGVLGFPYVATQSSPN